MKKTILTLSLFASITLFAQLPVGTIRKPIYTDTTNVVVSSPLTFTNNNIITVVPTASNHVARLQDIKLATNAIAAAIVTISHGGTSTNATILPGSWTNTADFITAGTNGAAAYKVGSVNGLNLTITNVIGSVSNVLTYGSGILTNNTKL